MRGPYGKNKFLVDQHKQEMCLLRKEGYGYHFIAKKLGISVYLVRQYTMDVAPYKSKTQSSIQEEIWELKYKKTSWDKLSKDGKRFRVLREQDGKCLWCSLDTWRGFPIPLEWDHVDGDKKNENRENVRFLCGNCHSQTETFSGKNSKVSRNQYGVFVRHNKTLKPRYKREQIKGPM